MVKQGLSMHDWKDLKGIMVKANDEQLVFIRDMVDVQFERRGYKK